MIDRKQGNVGWQSKAPTRRTVKLRVERTVHGQSCGNVANVVRLLKLVEVDHHFVPTRGGSENDLQIVYSIKGLSTDVVKLRVNCQGHDPKLIYERDLNDEEKKDGRKKLIKWNGVPTCKDGPLKELLPCPDYGPLKVSLWHAEIQSEEKTTWVLYREAKLEPVTWEEVYKSVTGLATNKFSDATTKANQQLWIQYKLNELGYLAGPLTDDAGSNSTLRALFRYTQAHPRLPKIVDFETLNAPAGTCSWGWKAKWEAKFGTIDNLCSGGTTSDGSDLMAKLQAGEQPRADVVEDPNVFVDRKGASRTIVDHDLHYINKDFSTVNANAEYDREFLNRFCWPLKIRYFLVAREDKDASKPGVNSPEAVGPAFTDWIAFDPPEDISCVPAAPKAQIPLKTRAREFITETHKKLAGQFGDKYNALDNCPQSAGGERPANGGDMSVYFKPVKSAPKDRTFIGCSVTQFKGSYIGGDNYFIQARLSLDGYPDSDSIKKEHLKLKGLEKAFDEPQPEPEPHPLHPQTGTITNWRRHRVLRELRWDSIDYPEINWYPIVDNFRAAHIILVPPKQSPSHVGKVLPPADLLNIARTLVADTKAEEPNKKEFQLRAAAAAFSEGGMYPVPLLSLTDWEASTMNTKAVSTDAAARFNEYKGYLKGTNDRWPTYDRVLPAARMMRESLNTLNSGHGLVIVRANYIPDPDFVRLLPADVHKASKSEHPGVKFTRGIAVGMDYGVVMLDRINTSRYAEPYFVTHEISHCLFGSHAFEPVSKADHDQNDKNCIMYYNEAGDKGNGGIYFGWGVKAVPDKYVMRLLVEYDVDQKADCGAITGGWIAGTRTAVKNPPNKDIEFRVFEFTGSVEEIRKAFAATTVTPAKWLDENRVFRVRLDQPTGQPPVSPRVSVKYPFDTRVSASGGKLRPLESITVEPMDIKAGEPRFCGKCLLKLRGWKVGTGGAAAQAPADSVPEKSKAVPINGRMTFDGYSVAEGSVTFNIKGADTAVQFGMDARDPGNPKTLMGPFQFLHKHTFSWESSSGDLKDLTGMLTREVVKYQRATQVAPFNEFADPDQQFAQTGGGAQDGNGSDMHSMRSPSLICSRNWGAPTGGSSLVAIQSYQYCSKNNYSLDDNDWTDIPNSQFRLEKSVYQMGKDWIMMFKKSNLASVNPIPFSFEVHYRIGPPLTFTPGLTANEFAGASQGAPKRKGDPLVQQLVWAAGDQTLDIRSKNLSTKQVTIEQLIKAGFAIRGSQPSK